MQNQIARARKTFVETDAGHAARAVAAQQPVRHGEALIHFGFTPQHGAVLDQLILIGREQELGPQFDVGALLAFLDPFGVWSGGALIFPSTQAAANGIKQLPVQS